MKTKISVLCCALFFLINCEPVEINTDTVIGPWNLIELTAHGIPETYNPGEHVWTFGDDSLLLEGSNSNFPEGKRRYLLVEYQDSLFIDTNYNPASPVSPILAHLEINDDEMTIDCNDVIFLHDTDTTRGLGFDGAFLRFER